MKFFAGAALSTLAMFLAGGSLRAGLILGSLLTLLPLLFWPRKALTILDRYGRAIDALRSKPEATKLAVIRGKVLRADTPDQRKTANSPSNKPVLNPELLSTPNLNSKLEACYRKGMTPGEALSAIQRNVA